MAPAIETIQLRKRYGQRTALNALDLRVEAGTVFGLIGPNGAGKTTTIRLLLDVIRPTSGSVRVLGEEPRKAGASLRTKIGYVPGELRLDGRVTGRAFLDFYESVSGREDKTTSRIACTLAERLGLDLSRPVRTLSKGNKQKLGLVQAFMHRPELLILDEPTSGLDPLIQREFLALVGEARDAGQTVLLSSHVLSEIQQTADRVAVLSAGHLVAQGEVAELRLGSIRHVHGLLQNTTAAQVSDALSKLSTLTELRVHDLADGVRFDARAEGSIDALIKILAVFTVSELTVEEPDLEESVLSLYGESVASPSPISVQTKRWERRKGEAS